MKLKTKKIIAREFLVLTVVAIIGVICFIIIFPYNSFRHHQIKSLREDIAQKSLLRDNLSQSYKAKIQNQEWYFKKLNDEFDLGEFNTMAKWWDRSVKVAKTDSINIKWKGIWTQDSTIYFFKKIGFNDGNSLKLFVITNSLNKSESESKIQAEKLQKEIDEIRYKQKKISDSILTHEEQLSFSILSLIVLLLIFFGVRYLYYGIKWSLKILKQKAD